jgi:hypothetical protein
VGRCRAERPEWAGVLAGREDEKKMKIEKKDEN